MKSIMFWTTQPKISSRFLTEIAYLSTLEGILIDSQMQYNIGIAVSIVLLIGRSLST